MSQAKQKDVDLELVLLAQGQTTNKKREQEEAFVMLYHKYVNIIYGYFYNKVNSRTDAEDLTSETFFKLTGSIKDFESRSSFKNWLFGIAKFTLMEHLRDKYKHATAELDDNHPEPDEDIEENTDAPQIIAEILNKLPEKHAKVLDLRFLKGYTISETAEELSLTVNNVKVIQNRALKKANVTFTTLNK